ncbi:MAG: high-affinity iron transporter [Methylophagaceae bacterium]|jgi:high-affinity iron transporter
MKIVSSLFAVAFLLLTQTVNAEPQQVLQLIDYVAVDYEGAVEKGRVINEVEYEEMLDFSAGIALQLAALPDNEMKMGLIEQGHTLGLLIHNKEAVVKIRQLITDMRHKVINSYQVAVIPQTQPDLKRGAVLYANQCASCHGAKGAGDGLASLEMIPPPVNFTDEDRYQQRTLYGLYNTTTQGVEGTGMLSYRQLSDEQRWSLAFYVGSLAIKTTDKTQELSNHPLADIDKLTTITPHQAAMSYGEKGASVMATLRSHPELVFNKRSNKLEFAKKKLAEVSTSYQNNNPEQAYQYAVEAYLDGFELIEQNINTLDSGLKLEIESAMTGLRNKIRAGEPFDNIAKEIVFINAKLDVASELLGTKSLSASATFTSAFFILLREGLEALLVVTALLAFLVRTKRKDALPYIHFGWIGAVVLGLMTWWASISLIDISGASREITEGVAAIVATVILLYVGFWMHDKSSAAKWKKFIDDSMHKAMSSGTLWTLTGLSFIAVYREAFETILFYQALWVQTGEAGHSMAFGGFLTAVAVLAVISLLIMRYSVRLPLRQFFSVTGGLMFVLAIIFAGKGIAALQEAGLIVSNPVAFIRVDLLGIYPNAQGLLLQLSLIIIAVILWNKKTKKA